MFMEPQDAQCWIPSLTLLVRKKLRLVEVIWGASGFKRRADIIAVMG